MLSMGHVPELLTVGEAAQALRVSQETIRIWARTGRLKPVPMPTRIVRFRREDIEAIVTGEPAESAV
jgi:excisionase family DNA binding protein